MSRIITLRVSGYADYEYSYAELRYSYGTVIR